MYSTCIHCTADLGRNDALEEFQVGRRLAFDPAKGRLWVVCHACARWNLSPLEERWEAIEAAERRYRDTRLRVSTDEIGLARLREGLDLIRIGAPQRPEMAAWRYGDQFGRRRKRQLLITGAVTGSVVALAGGALWIGTSFLSFAGLYMNGGVWDGLIHGRADKVVARLPLAEGKVVKVQRKHARMSALHRAPAGSAESNQLRLRLESEKGTHLLTGDDAMRAAARLLPTVNRFGGSRDQVRDAVSLLDEIGDPHRVLTTLQQRHGATASDPMWGHNKPNVFGDGRSQIKKLPGTLHTLAPRDRLALEMALHEESERRAMDGELAALEAQWREAEEIAKIADDMFVAPAVDEKLSRLRDDTPKS